ncbi:hypothetical protein HYH03_014843 [Edaphochlamys debaryana]|uniref:Uncharacterized protein n=1 Tax=Edaphochlamys debaryana TaxID=47281 RepID=A0A835XKN8_9CHLO|nr:hypothetical protein HYH03_014843 [Edaphochlamys debaryana]|eukprot:KAG2486542.1 hypothetical protein HYH03_014843 [Edaphochlamys debaryana]
MPGPLPAKGAQQAPSNEKPTRPELPPRVTGQQLLLLVLKEGLLAVRKAVELALKALLLLKGPLSQAPGGLWRLLKLILSTRVGKVLTAAVAGVLSISLHLRRKHQEGSVDGGWSVSVLFGLVRLQGSLTLRVGAPARDPSAPPSSNDDELRINCSQDVKDAIIRFLEAQAAQAAKDPCARPTWQLSPQRPPRPPPSCASAGAVSALAPLAPGPDAPSGLGALQPPDHAQHALPAKQANHVDGLGGSSLAADMALLLPVPLEAVEAVAEAPGASDGGAAVAVAAVVDVAAVVAQGEGVGLAAVRVNGGGAAAGPGGGGNSDDESSGNDPPTPPVRPGGTPTASSAAAAPPRGTGRLLDGGFGSEVAFAAFPSEGAPGSAPRAAPVPAPGHHTSYTHPLNPAHYALPPAGPAVPLATSSAAPSAPSPGSSPAYGASPASPGYLSLMERAAQYTPSVAMQSAAAAAAYVSRTMGLAGAGTTTMGPGSPSGAWGASSAHGPHGAANGAGAVGGGVRGMPGAAPGLKKSPDSILGLRGMGLEGWARNTRAWERDHEEE